MSVEIIHADARYVPQIADRSVHAIITSPPYYGLRRYLDPTDPLADSQIGAEQTPAEYVANILECSWEWRRVLRDDGVLWLNIGDSYANDGKWGGATGGKHARGLHGASTSVGRKKRQTGLPPKSLCMIPEEVARALRRDGWILRASVPWYKGNVMPNSVRDRPTTAHEMLYLFAKQPTYFWDHVAVMVPLAFPNAADGSRVFGGKNKHGANIKHQRTQGRVYDAPLCGRFLRTSDLFRAGLDAYIEHLQEVRDRGGLLLDPDGDPLALLVNTQRSELKHFAMWPPKLVAPLIKASTSERGCCPACGASWRRDPTQRETKDWAPNCACDAGEPVPCVVYDPFGGTGTTAKVAQDLGRRAIITELNRAYIPLAELRTATT